MGHYYASYFYGGFYFDSWYYGGGAVPGPPVPPEITTELREGAGHAGGYFVPQEHWGSPYPKRRLRDRQDEEELLMLGGGILR